MECKALGIDKLEAAQGRLLLSFKDRTAIPPRAFTILAKRNRTAYVTREGYIWPYTGNPLVAIENLLSYFTLALKEIDAARASLGV
jgi:hypothetical protein